jgi:hypothetical protein
MRLPDFIFGRNEDREAAVGLRLAGVIITDFPKPEAQLSVAEWREIQDFVDELVAAAGRTTPISTRPVFGVRYRRRTASCRRSPKRS